MADDPLRHPRLELTAAAAAISNMGESKSMEEFEQAWRAYLNNIEKCWVKVERSCQHVVNQFQPWQGQYTNLRKKDMLLRYLKQARDADNHSVQDVAQMEPGSASIQSRPGADVHTIRHMEVRNGKIVHYDGDPLVMTITPPQPVAVRVKNNGEWYNPPTSHLGKPVTSRHPIHLASLGLAFYSDYLEKVHQKFFAAAP
jgi:hypothetical protein